MPVILFYLGNALKGHRPCYSAVSCVVFCESFFRFMTCFLGGMYNFCVDGITMTLHFSFEVF